MGDLAVTFDDAVHVAAPGERVTFGRLADRTLKLDRRDPDENLSRRTGEFRWDGARWTVVALSDRLELVVELDGGGRATLPPGSDAYILPAGAAGSVVVQTTRRYEIGFAHRVAVSGGSVDPMTTEIDGDGQTSDLRHTLKVNDAELRLLAAMCEPRLRRPGDGLWELPTTAELIDRLRLTGDRPEKRIEDLVDSLTRKLSGVVDGLAGDNRRRATRRRERICEYALHTRLVTTRDLRLLDEG